MCVTAVTTVEELVHPWFVHSEKAFIVATLIVWCSLYSISAQDYFYKQNRGLDLLRQSNTEGLGVKCTVTDSMQSSV